MYTYIAPLPSWYNFSCGCPSFTLCLFSQIGVRFSKLRALEDKYPTDAEKAREEVVTMWLERDTNPTWARLADAFEYAGQRALARKIRETYNCKLTKDFASPELPQ